MITDKSTFAYLADVFILPEHQGEGLSKRLMEYIMAHPDLQGLRRMVLATMDAHELYRKFGFNELEKPQTFMDKRFKVNYLGEKV
jgi:N-acetylglutamate synthase-like GNAT family acetyltransferase